MVWFTLLLRFMSSHSAWPVCALIQNTCALNVQRKSAFCFSKCKGLNESMELVEFSASKEIENHCFREMCSDYVVYSRANFNKWLISPRLNFRFS